MLEDVAGVPGYVMSPDCPPTAGSCWGLILARRVVESNDKGIDVMCTRGDSRSSAT